MKEFFQRHKKLIVGLGIFLAVLLLVGALGIGYMVYVSGLDQDQILLAEIDTEDDELSYYLLPFGKTEEEAVLLARRVTIADLYMLYREGGQPVQIGQPLNLGGFLPGSNTIYFWYMDDEEVVINKKGSKDKEPVVIYEDESEGVTGYILDENGRVFLKEERDSSDTRCYLYVPAEDLTRIAKGSDCIISRDWQHVMLVEVDDGQTTASVMDINGENETSVLDEEEGVSTLVISADGSLVAYVQQNEDIEQVIVEDTESGKAAFESDEFLNVSILAFAETGNTLYFTGEDEEGLITLYYVANGDATEVDSGYAVIAEFNASGTALAYVVKDEDGEMKLGIFSPDGVKEKNLISAEQIKFRILKDPERILAVQTDEDELTVSSILLDGSDPLELFNDKDMALGEGYYLPGENMLYLTLTGEDGMYLYTTPLDAEDSGFMLVEEWYAIYLLNRNPAGGSVLWTGAEESDDDIGLYISTIEDNSKTETLDDDDIGFVINAVFDPKGQTVLYSALIGKDEDELEVRQVGIDGKSRYEAVYPDDIMLDVTWDVLFPFSALMDELGGKGQISWMQPIKGVTYCPGADTLHMDGRGEGNLSTEQTTCYLVQLDTETTYTFKAYSETDTRIDLYNATGSNIASDDDSGEGFNPMLRIRVDESGRYFVVVHPLEESNRPYSITLSEGTGDPAFDNATLLPENRTLSGQVTSSSRINFEIINEEIYGTVYYFEGSSGDQITIDVLGPSIGSNVDPAVTLYDANAVALISDDDSGEGYDAKLTFTLPADGRYYAVVRSVYDRYGSSSSYYYQIRLTVR